MMKRFAIGAILFLVVAASAQLLGPAIGGTGSQSVTAHVLAVAEGAQTPYNFVAAGTTGAMLIGQGGAADPVFTTNSLLLNCGTTTTCGQTSQSTGSHISFGSCPFSAASTCTVTSLAAYTSSSSYFCVVTEASNTGVTFKVANVSTTSFTITASASNSDTVNYQCIGS